MRVSITHPKPARIRTRSPLCLRFTTDSVSAVGDPHGQPRRDPLTARCIQVFDRRRRASYFSVAIRAWLLSGSSGRHLSHGLVAFVLGLFELVKGVDSARPSTVMNRHVGRWYTRVSRLPI